MPSSGLSELGGATPLISAVQHLPLCVAEPLKRDWNNGETDLRMANLKAGPFKGDLGHSHRSQKLLLGAQAPTRPQWSRCFSRKGKPLLA